MIFNLNDLIIERYLKNNCTNVALVNNKILGRQQVFKEISEFNDTKGLLLASSFEKNTKITGFVFNKEKLVGYLEEYYTEKPYSYKQNEKILFLQHCEENIFLSKFGYINLDPATLNFFKDINIGFDKSLVIQINKISETMHFSYEQLFNNSYENIDLKYVEIIQNAFLSKNKDIIHNTFKEIYNSLSI